MGNRSIDRAQAKMAYEQFSKLWRRERRSQISTGDKIPEDIKLGRKPTFKQWMNAVRSSEARKTVSPEIVQEHINDIQELDLEWKDE